jgi:hypothetical protein
MVNTTAKAALTNNVRHPSARVILICHHINRPETPQKTITNDIKSTMAAQAQRTPTEYVYP